MADLPRLTSEDLDTLLARATEPGAAPHDIAELEHWVGDDPDRAALVQRMQAIYAALPPRQYRPDHLAALARTRVRYGIGTPVASPTTRHPQQHAPRRWFNTVSAAAAAIVIVLVGWVVFSHARNHNIVGPSLTYVTHNGQRADVRLPDGSTVTLSVASRIEVPQNFGKGTRLVRLTGEAYFRVAHANGAPFIVDAAGTQTKVLGTEFSIRAYHTGDVQVAVQSGRVAVGNVILSASDIAWTAGSQVTVAHHQDLSAPLGFITGKLILRQVALADAVDALDRWYDVDIRFGDPVLRNNHINGILFGGSIGDLMEILHTTFGIRVVRDGRILTLYPQSL